jgi:hypothetical protein
VSRLYKIAFGLLALSVLAYLVSRLPSFVWHPLGACTGVGHAIRDCKGYNFWSGIISDLSEITLIGAAVTFGAGWYHQHNCHVEKCPWLVFHVHPLHGHPVCKKHWMEEGSEHGLHHPHHGLPTRNATPLPVAGPASAPPGSD